MFNLPEYGNERDIEIPLLIEFLKKNSGTMNNVLDVGSSQSAYLPLVRDLCKRLDGVDLLKDEKCGKYLDRFFHGDFLTEDLFSYDLVFSVSTLEHIGVEYLPTPLYRENQLEALCKIVRLTRRAFFVSFPYGEDILVSGYFHQFDRKFLDDFRILNRSVKLNIRFFSTDNPRNRAGWREIPQSLADKATPNLDVGISTICVLEGYL